MKLEIKHLAIAFTNNWKVTYFDDERELNQVCNIVELREDECTISNGEYEYDVKFDDIKLLCFSLSALTKEITINGESFIPINEIKNLELFSHYELEDFVRNNFTYGYIESLSYQLLSQLFEWKLDVFGLIDAGLAEPVTEDFNHYK